TRWIKSRRLLKGSQRFCKMIAVIQIQPLVKEELSAVITRSDLIGIMTPPRENRGISPVHITRYLTQSRWWSTADDRIRIRHHLLIPLRRKKHQQKKYKEKASHGRLVYPLMYEKSRSDRRLDPMMRPLHHES